MGCFFEDDFFAGIFDSSFKGILVSIASLSASVSDFPAKRLDRRSKEFNWPLFIHSWSLAWIVFMFAFATSFEEMIVILF
jgi:hypothetical protein